MTTTKFAAGDLTDTPDGRGSIIGLTSDQDGLPAYRVAFPSGAHATYSDYELARVGECLGIEIPEIFDGVAVWIDSDGALTNRLKSWSGFEREADLVDRWIAAANRIIEGAFA